MLIYSQSTGLLTLNRSVLGVGYSGHGNAVNNPDMEAIKGVGPVPRGLYVMGQPVYSPNTGRYTLSLTPQGHDAHNRTLLRMHGDNSLSNLSASHGCIIQRFPVRVRAWTENEDHLITVVR